MTRIRLIGAFESTYQPAFDVDVAEATGHADRWREDLELLRSFGVEHVRYPVRWHRVEADPARWDWDETAEILDYMRERGLRPIVDLLHHTSYPRWVGDFGSPGFGDAYLRYVEAFAERFPWIPAYTLFNEPFTTFLLCGQQGIWPPHRTGLRGFLSLARNVMPAVAEASRMLRDLLPDARHVHVETCERAHAAAPAAVPFVEFVNDRRFFLTDLLVGRPVDESGPFASAVIEAGGEDLLALEPGHVDVLGLDYYAHNQWDWTAPWEGRTCSACPTPFAELAAEYCERYRLPLVVGETNIRGFPSDRATWLKYMLEQCEAANHAGVPVSGLCWFPFVDSCDWDSILCRADGSLDPVGVVSLDQDLARRETSMSEAFQAAAVGVRAADLPAYDLQPPVRSWLAGWLPQMEHWNWSPVPEAEIEATLEATDYELELRVVERGV